jgi:hypothetical protein
MPAENEFERSVQSMLDGLQVNPAPSDWQAVYEQLHPTKKRRIIWWWLPVLLALVVAGVWMRNEPSANSRPAVVGIGNTAAKEQNPPISPAEINTEKEPSPANSASANAADEESKQAVNDRSAIQQAAEVPAANALLHDNIDHALVENKKQEDLSSTSATNADTVDPAFLIANGYSLTEPFHIKASSHYAVPAASMFSPQPDHSTELPSLAASAATPQLKKQRHWNWMLYAGAGINISASPLTMTKASQDMSSGSPTNVTLVTQSQQSGGWHGSAGVLVQHALGRKWNLQIGAGFNYGTWHGNSQTYRDSFSTGPAVTYRSLVMTQAKSYNALMLEIPIHINYKLAGKKNNGWWLTAGLNNQFVLSVKEKNSTTQALQAGTSADPKSLTGSATTWQPQLRAGFVFDRQGKKTHWQLSPLANLTLPTFFKSSVDDMGIHNIQLQFRYYLNSRQ